MFLPRNPFARASSSAAVSRSYAERELAAQIARTQVALDRVGGNDDALDQLVRITLHEHAVLEGRRLALVTVHHEVAREQVGRAGTTTSARSRSWRRPGRAGPTASPAPARRRDRLWPAPRATSRTRRVADAASIVHESSGRSRSRLVTMRRSSETVISQPSPTRRLSRKRSATTRSGARRTRSRSVLLHQRLGRLRRQLLVELVVDLHRRCTPARRETLHLFDGHVVIERVPLLERSRISGPPVTRHVTFVHTDTINRPHGRRLNIV